MLTRALLSASLISLGFSGADLECPDGSRQIGVINAAVSTRIGSAYTLFTTIDQCQAQCALVSGCVSFSWAPLNGYAGDEFLEETVCQLHDSIIPDTTQGDNTILCRPECELAFESDTTASFWGDPHFTTFNGVAHHFQGEQAWNGESYYLMIGCDTNDVSSMPWRLSMTVFPWGYSGPTVCYYITLEMHEDNGDVYYMWFSSEAALLKVAQVPYGTSHDLSDVEALGTVTFSSFNDAGWTSPSGKFVVSPSGAGSTSVTTTLTVQQPLDDGSTISCSSSFTITYGGAWTANNGQTYKWHTVKATAPPCYKCETCGLFGDFKHAWGSNSLQMCDGTSKTYTTTWWPGTDGWDASGWSWDVENVFANCAGHYDAVTPPEEATCSDEVAAAALLECATAREELALCCYKIGGNFCQYAQTACEDDICVMAGDDLSQVSALVQAEFTDLVTAECLNNATNPVPSILYEFDDDLCETISDCDPAYELTAQGDAKVCAGVLKCDGKGDSVYVEGLSLDLESFSMELIMRIKDTEDGGTIMTIEQDDNFASIAYNVLTNNNKKKVSMASNMQGYADDENAGVSQNTPLTRFEQFKWVEETSGSTVIQVVAVFDMANDRMTLYRDAEVMLDFAPASDEHTFLDGSGDNWQLELCAKLGDARGFRQNFEGDIMQASFYEYALTEDDVYQLFETKMPSWLNNEIECINDELMPGRSLNEGQCILSANGLYALVLDDNKLKIVAKSVDSYTTIKDFGLSGVEYVKYGTDGSFIAYDDFDNIISEIVAANDDAGNLIMTSTGALQAFSFTGGAVYYDSSDDGTTSAQSVGGGAIIDEPIAKTPVEYKPEQYEPVNYVRPMQPVQPLNPVDAPAGPSAVGTVTNAMMQNLLFVTIFLLVANLACMGWGYCSKKDARGKYNIVSVNTDTEMDV